MSVTPRTPDGLNAAAVEDASRLPPVPRMSAFLEEKE